MILHRMLRESNNVLAYDDFHEAEDTIIETKNLDMGGYYVKAREYTAGNMARIKSGKASQDRSGFFFLASNTDVKTGDVIVTADMVFGDGTVQFAGLGGRWNGVNYVANSAGSFIHAYAYGSGVAAKSMRIVQTVNGVDTTLVNDATKYPTPGTTYQGILKLEGTTATWTLVGVGTVTATIPASSAGRFGFSLFQGSTYHSTIDNFQVVRL